MSITDSNLSLHFSNEAIDAYSAGFELRDDERSIVEKFFPGAPAKVLDLGVGNGRTTVALAKMGYQTIGIEYCGELLEHGKAAFPQVDLRQGDARNLDFPENHFDVTWFSTNGIDYMHPVAEREKVLHEMIRCTKPGGLIAIWSHNAFGVLRRLLSPPALTRRALQFALDQIVAWKRRSGWYFVWRDQFLGRPLFYSAPPSHQVQKFRQLGLEIVEVRSVERPGRAVSWWQDVHVLYVCRKPL